MVEVVENVMPISKKHFLMRQLEHHYITQEEYDVKIEPLDKEIDTNLQRYLNEAQELMRSLKEVKVTTFSDGDRKRNAARALIEFLRQYYTAKEIKGIARQAYKIMRTEVSDADD